MVQQQKSRLAKYTFCRGSGGPISTPRGWPSNLTTDATCLCKSSGTKKAAIVIHASNYSDTDASSSYSLPWSNSSVGPIDEWHPNPRAVGYSLGWPWRTQVRLNKWCFGIVIVSWIVLPTLNIGLCVDVTLKMTTSMSHQSSIQRAGHVNEG